MVFLGEPGLPGGVEADLGVLTIWSSDFVFGGEVLGGRLLLLPLLLLELILLLLFPLLPLLLLELTLLARVVGGS